MKIVESWEDHHTDIYAIVRHSEKERRDFKLKEYEALYLLDGEVNSFGGAVGYKIADFDTVEEVEEFLLKGIYECDNNPDIWLQMVETN